MMKIVKIGGHFEVYDQRGQFVLSADSYAEALAEIEALYQIPAAV